MLEEAILSANRRQYSEPIGPDVEFVAGADVLVAACACIVRASVQQLVFERELVTTDDLVAIRERSYAGAGSDPKTSAQVRHAIDHLLHVEEENHHRAQ